MYLCKAIDLITFFPHTPYTCLCKLLILKEKTCKEKVATRPIFPLYKPKFTP